MLDLDWGEAWTSHTGLLPNVTSGSDITDTWTSHTRLLPNVTSAGTQDDASVGAGSDITDAWPVLERRSTVRELLKMKRQIQDGMFLRQRRYVTGHRVTRSGAHSGQSPENMDSASSHSYSFSKVFCLEPEDPPEPPHPSPGHTDSSQKAYHSPPHTDLSPGHALSMPPAAVPTSPSPPYPCSGPPQRSAPGSLTAPGSLLAPGSLSGPSTTLFQWQVQQQIDKMRGVPPEMVNLQDSDGDTALHIAVAQGKRALAYVLAANMALSGTLDVPEHNGQTALHIAAATDQYLIVSDLLGYGAQVHRRDAWGRSPFHVCVEKGHVRSLQNMFRTLKATGKDFNVDLVNYQGLTPLHVAVLAHNATYRQLSTLERSCSAEERDGLLMKEGAFLECVKALLQMGASCRTWDQKSGRTSVHMAAEEANAQLLRLFLNQPATVAVVNRRTYSGNTALHIVCALQSRRGQLEALHMLMQAGADPGAHNHENELPCQLLAEGGSTERMRQVLKGRYFQM